MRVVISRTVDFRPEWGGNKGLPSAEQLIVHIRYPTVEERKRYVSMDIGFVGGAQAGDYRPKVEMRSDFEGLIRKHVTGIAGFTVADAQSESETHITTADQLLALPGVHELVQEIGTEIAGMVAAPDRLDPPSKQLSGAGVGDTPDSDWTPGE